MDIDELELRNGLSYQKSSDKPFTGKVSGKRKKVGFIDGKLDYIGHFKDGKEESLWEYFNNDGSLNRTKTWKDDVKID